MATAKFKVASPAAPPLLPLSLLLLLRPGLPLLLLLCSPAPHLLRFAAQGTFAEYNTKAVQYGCVPWPNPHQPLLRRIAAP
jgi:hypothetical protein